LGKKRRFAPGSDREKSIVSLARFLEFSGTHIHAKATTIDLAGAKVDEIERALGHTAFSHGCNKSHQRLHHIRNQHCGVFHSWFYGFHFASFSLFRFCWLSAGKISRPHNGDVWHPRVSTFSKRFFTALRAAMRATQSPAGDTSMAREGASTNQ